MSNWLDMYNAEEDASMYKQGGLIKRADGSYSKRGLWDNIRANKGSGRKPTVEMLEQERKIKKHADGSFVEGEDPKTNKVQGNNPLMNLSEAQRFPAPVQTTVTYPEGYVNQMFDLKNPVLNTMGKPYATGAVEQSVSPLDFIGAAKGAIGLGKGLLKYRNLMKPNYVELGGQMIDIGAHPRAVNRAVNQMHKGAQQVALPSPFADGSWVADSSIPTPTTPSFYPAGKDRTLTNYQMGTPKARMYAAGSTVWTKQNTPLWAAGTPTPTATQNFRNTGSLNTDLYRIGDVIPTGMNYKTPAAGTHDYSKDIQPYHTMRLHAPDTTMMARHGGHIKKHINSPRVYGNPVNPSGMYADGSTVGTPPNFKPGKEYAKGWYTSPMYKSIIEKQAATLYPDNPKKVQKYVNLFLENPTNNYLPPSLIKGLTKKQEAYGINFGENLQIDKDFALNNPQLVNSLYAHELFHDNAQTNYDFDYITKQTPKFNSAIHPKGILGKASSWDRYAGLTHPEEVRSEIHAIRELGKEHGIYDPFTQPFTKDYLEKVNTIYNSGDFDGKNYNQLQRLKDYYSDDQIIDMMNTISQNNNQPTTNTQMAKRGGYVKNNNSNTWLDSYN